MRLCAVISAPTMADEISMQLGGKHGSSSVVCVGEILALQPYTEADCSLTSDLGNCAQVMTLTVGYQQASTPAIPLSHKLLLPHSPTNSVHCYIEGHDSLSF